MKTCQDCHETKPLSEFYDAPRGKGKSHICKKCAYLRVKAWKEANQEKSREYQKEYHRKRYVEHRDEFLQKAKQRYRQSIQYFKDYYRKNKERLRNPESNAAVSHAYRARKCNAPGRFTAAEWKALKQKYNFTCLRCERREPEIKLTVDHVLPLAKGGINTIDNIQSLCLSCNSSKESEYIDYRR